MVHTHPSRVSGGVECRDHEVGHAAERATLQLQLCGITLDHLVMTRVLDRVGYQLTHPTATPLALGSINLDHVHHFGDHRATRPVRLGVNLDWQMLIDGAPVARRAAAVTGLPWSRLPGADLLPDLLGVAERTGARVGFLGGLPESIPVLRRHIAAQWPDLAPVSFWTPPRSVVDDPTASRDLALRIADEGVDLLVVGLGKPRQERWIEAHGVQTRARVLGAFGAAADFLAGSARRAPAWMRRAGCEWAFRLLQEPRRLSRRYLVEGPAALLALRQATPIVAVSPERLETAELAAAREPAGDGLAQVTGPSPRPRVREPSPRW